MGYLMGDIHAPLNIFFLIICKQKATFTFFQHPLFICNCLERPSFGTIFFVINRSHMFMACTIYFHQSYHKEHFLNSLCMFQKICIFSLLIFIIFGIPLCSNVDLQGNSKHFYYTGKRLVYIVGKFGLLFYNQVVRGNITYFQSENFIEEIQS